MKRLSSLKENRLDKNQDTIGERSYLKYFEVTIDFPWICLYLIGLALRNYSGEII
jgi:hypothetical protein